MRSGIALCSPAHEGVGVNHQRISIAGPAGRLQAIYQPGRADKPKVVICHPHPCYGGTMRNRVVYWMARAFEEQGCAVLRFNFRGVEQSEGVWDNGVGESDDAHAALDWLDRQQPATPLWLAGFSFGCYAGLRAARHDERVHRMFAVSPAVEHYSFNFMAGEFRPLTIIQGERDEVVSADAVIRWAQTVPHAEVIRVADAGHFYPNHQHELQQALSVC
ncbi:MAG: alpha/beta fold hydrolase [Mariprofundales bacterium]|nr:alpha/beta fold hydrolase [Mariprofundales bacterium]